MAAFDLLLVGLAADRLNSPPADADLLDGTRAYLEEVTVEEVLTLGDEMPRRAPAAVVGLVAQDYDEGAAPEAGNFQRARAVLGVWHVLECRNTKRGERSLDPMAEFLGATRDVLQAWLPPGVPPGHADPLRLRRGQLVQIANNRAVWLDEYVFSWRPAGRQIQQN